MTSPAGYDLRRYLETSRFEVLPLRGVSDTVAQILPASSTVTVTSSPAKGIAATVETANALKANGFTAVPHLAARLIIDQAHLGELLAQLTGAGIDEVFVIGGDAPEPAGRFPDALSLLRGMEELGARPRTVGITGYPERHATIPDAVTARATGEKARYADYLVSQICYDPNTIATWVKSLRARGVELPVHIGAPGAVDAAKLLRISMKIGLGDSMRFLRKQRGVVGRLISGYTPESLLDELAPYLLDPAYRIAGLHLFTFNEIAKTWRWLADMAARGKEDSA